MSSFQELGIRLKKSSGQEKTLCPRCSHNRKPKNRKNPCLSVSIDEGIFNCKNCGWTGSINDKSDKPEYKKPETKGKIKSADQSIYDYFLNRGLSKSTVDTVKVAMSNSGMIMFPYLRNEVLVNYKLKAKDKSRMMQAPGAEPIMFNYDNCVGKKEIIINEGEEDAMSWIEAGVISSTSVNAGAPNETDSTADKKLQCITNCYELFEEAEVVYIGVDNDPNGRRLQAELVRRIGFEKCKAIDYSPYKDANKVLEEEGAESLLKRKEEAKDIKMDGIFYVDDVRKNMIDRYKMGKPRGTTTHVKKIDACWTWKPQEVNLWTGYNNEGKSLFLEFLALLKAYWDGWKFAFFTPENMPIEDFFDELIEMFVGKSCDKYYENAPYYMNIAEYEAAMNFINKHFFSILPEDDDFTLDSLFERAKYLVRKEGIRALIIDPYNWVEHLMLPGEREDLYISRFMSKLKKFAKTHDLSLHLVAHQNTPGKDSSGKYPRPSKFTVKGGGTFSDKTDNLMFVWRPNLAIDFTDTEVVFGSQKIKKQKLVGIPQDVMGIEYDRKTHRYVINGIDPFAKIDRHRKGEQIEIEEVDPLVDEAKAPVDLFSEEEEEETGWMQFKDNNDLGNEAPF